MHQQQVLMYSTGNHTRCPVINHNEKNILKEYVYMYGASRVALVVKNAPAPAGDTRDVGWIPGLERSPGEGNGNPPQNSPGEFPWAEEPGGLRSIGSQRVRHDWSDLARMHTYICITESHGCTAEINTVNQLHFSFKKQEAGRDGRGGGEFMQLWVGCIEWRLNEKWCWVSRQGFPVDTPPLADG